MTFILWVVFAVATPALRTIPQGPGIILGMNLVIVVLFNAVPELIYLGHHSSLELLTESYRFIGDNWIEWFPATIVMAVPLVLLAEVQLPGVLAHRHGRLLALWVYFSDGRARASCFSSRTGRPGALAPSVTAPEAESAGARHASPLRARPGRASDSRARAAARSTR
mgnify:CR=1 FL=1